jgi:predicted RNA-binding Zn ribbon-like protein
MRLDAFDFSTLDPLRDRLCLDFTNSTPFHFNLSEDHLTTYADLLSWSLDVGLLREDEGEALLAAADRRPADAAAVFQKAVALREAIFAILAGIAHDRTPAAHDLDTLNAALSEAMAHMRIVPRDDAYGWECVDGGDDLAQMLWPVAWSAGELLMSDDLKYIRECDGHECEWLFLDTSRNHSRRWCDMKTCGNRAKAKRHYHRTQSDTDPDHSSQ